MKATRSMRPRWGGGLTFDQELSILNEEDGTRNSGLKKPLLCRFVAGLGRGGKDKVLYLRFRVHRR